MSIKGCYSLRNFLGKAGKQEIYRSDVLLEQIIRNSVLEKREMLPVYGVLWVNQQCFCGKFCLVNLLVFLGISQTGEMVVQPLQYTLISKLGRVYRLLRK